jgi:hypothetical protein
VLDALWNWCPDDFPVVSEYARREFGSRFGCDGQVPMAAQLL